VTHPLSEKILGGVTRSVVLELARADGIAVVERPFSLAEAQAAREAALSSTSSLLLPVTAEMPEVASEVGPIATTLIAAR
jgi:D-alanine transaminase